MKFLTETPAGGYPSGFLVVSNLTEKTLDEGIKDLKALMPENAFFGRGKHKGPQIIFTDDDTAEINSLKKAWPNAIFLQCQWHILQVRIGFNIIPVQARYFH